MPPPKDLSVLATLHGSQNFIKIFKLQLGKFWGEVLLHLLFSLHGVLVNVLMTNAPLVYPWKRYVHWSVKAIEFVIYRDDVVKLFCNSMLKHECAVDTNGVINRHVTGREHKDTIEMFHHKG